MSSSDDAATRLQRAQQAKTDGTAFFKEGNFKKASFHYKHVYLHVAMLGSRYKQHQKLLGQEADAGGVAQLTGKTDSTATKVGSPEEQRAIDDVIAMTNLNLAMAHLRLGRAPQAAQCCSITLLYKQEQPIDDSAAAVSYATAEDAAVAGKALFRRATAFLVLKQTEEARVDLVAAAVLLPAAADDIAVKMGEVQSLEAEATRKERQVFKGMSFE
jgi:hypothetical protein